MEGREGGAVVTLLQKNEKMLGGGHPGPVISEGDLPGLREDRWTPLRA